MIRVYCLSLSGMPTQDERRLVKRMAKNRKIPFGYMMQDGRITTNPKEVLAVITIFQSYLNGESLVNIAHGEEGHTSDPLNSR